ncbi:PAAR motif-containing protein [Orbus hercynius]|uniref:PAAR motif-containing protein n=1 Tax=Orbus hercynius TaxID=593135 RepID=A0A495RKX7_9GAMM|nr:PAAR motif-containing protein [Orbus hercynius]
MNCNGSAVALLGDKATCPKCKSMGSIIEGATNWTVQGKPAAYDGCIIACGCSPVGCNRIIATKSHLFVDVGGSYRSASSPTFASDNLPSSSDAIQDNSLLSQPSNLQHNTIIAEDNSALIRADARRLLQCADELCEKHLYYQDIKQEFRRRIRHFANDIVNQC